MIDLWGPVPDDVRLIIDVIFVGLGLLAISTQLGQFRRWVRFRRIYRVWGLSGHGEVVVVCSQVPDFETRQWYTNREFVQSARFGDLDALSEVTATLRFLYPALSIKVFTATDLQHTDETYNSDVILIGGPDYNDLTARVMRESGETIVRYPHFWRDNAAETPEDEISLMVSPTAQRLVSGKRFAEPPLRMSDRNSDYGYFEKLNNPFNELRTVILIGGCHTIGVTASAKMFSVARAWQSETIQTVTNNATRLLRTVGHQRTYAVIVEGSRIQSSVATPSWERMVQVVIPERRRAWVSRIERRMRMLRSIGRQLRRRSDN